MFKDFSTLKQPCQDLAGIEDLRGLQEMYTLIQQARSVGEMLPSNYARVRAGVQLITQNPDTGDPEDKTTTERETVADSVIVQAWDRVKDLQQQMSVMQNNYPLSTNAVTTSVLSVRIGSISIDKVQGSWLAPTDADASAILSESGVSVTDSALLGQMVFSEEPEAVYASYTAGVSPTVLTSGVTPFQVRWSGRLLFVPLDETHVWVCMSGEVRYLTNPTDLQPGQSNSVPIFVNAIGTRGDVLDREFEIPAFEYPDLYHDEQSPTSTYRWYDFKARLASDKVSVRIDVSSGATCVVLPAWEAVGLRSESGVVQKDATCDATTQWCISTAAPIAFKQAGASEGILNYADKIRNLETAIGSLLS
jgi:hypothetical protein